MSASDNQVAAAGTNAIQFKRVPEIVAENVLET
ncbi:uncharacterized protein Nmag_2674 [Natrialba magadii ATCC 43099]|uniref:Uncharacterized protein n=1 Tax=Natrialba magadii (strain ATCC 43099 / DSM 3394 / CCM 3739 / CIP 104546 / IAM 13178 / JCM 8861 / NBRC 102185 / NCIMB 2190 / MS3) TaxID=547559 RepID=D3SZ40_NATMM|nr:uncharacterized protein Nmag_2674 [Natrialba magadii ATCC 43099]